MAGKYGPDSVLLYVDGFNLISPKLTGVTGKSVAETTETTGLGDSWREHTPTGQQSAEVTQEGAFWDTTTNYTHDAFKAAAIAGGTAQSDARVVVIGFGGDTLGQPFLGFQAFNMDYEVLATVGELQKVNSTYQCTGQSDAGAILQVLATKTADWHTEATAYDHTTDTGQRVIPITSNSAASPSVVTTTVPHGYTSGDVVLIAGVADSDATINGQRIATVISTTTFSVPVNATTSAGTGGTVVRADSASGGVAYQQITAFSGFSAFVGKVRDSPDDSTWADLATFASASAIGGQRVEVSGDVDRYLAYKGDVTGSGSITVWGGFARS